MEQLLHFSHDHMLSLVYLQPNHNKENFDDGEEDDYVAEDHHGGQCNMCNEKIYSFHLCYYNCKDCDYSLHKFCAEMPTTLQNHPLHAGHKLTLAAEFQVTEPDYSSGPGDWMCGVCNLKREKFFNYHCSICEFNMDIICATMYQQKIEHPSHPHQLQRMSKQLVSHCNACGIKHEGTFYHCITCSWFWIHLECALMPSKFLIQQSTNGNFTHPHPLTLAYSFPHIDRKSKFYPRCRVCDKGFYIYLWFYKCDKCRYYVHIGCATSTTCICCVQIIFPGLGKTLKNYKDDYYPNLLRCPFPDENHNLLKHHFFNQKKSIVQEKYAKTLNHFNHQHPLILLDSQTSLGNKSILLHNPMKKIQLLCNGCVKPITAMPFYKCSEDVQNCGFVLHEWCTRLPSEVAHHPGHEKHALVLQSNIPSKFFGVFTCDICSFSSNGFAYGCTACDFYVDTNCAFLPKEITHDAQPDHLLSRIINAGSIPEKRCNACGTALVLFSLAFSCLSCKFYLHPGCAFFLPRITRHKYDKHPLSLRYNPVENHPGDYFCEVCEDEFNPQSWFYHCSSCAGSIHPACAPMILQSEQSVYPSYKRRCVFRFVNIKFGGTLEIRCHPHRLAFVQGIKSHGQCKQCDGELQYKMIFKCLECEYALHFDCASLLCN